MKVLAIDPGNVKSAWLTFDSDTQRPTGFGITDNQTLLRRLREDWPLFGAPDITVLEHVESFGMAVGKTVFDTCIWIGRFIEAVGGDGKYRAAFRKDIKLHICGTHRAKDANIRQALIDRFGPQGTKKEPGITYGIKEDIWSALAIAVTFSDQNSNV